MSDPTWRSSSTPWVLLHASTATSGARTMPPRLGMHGLDFADAPQVFCGTTSTRPDDRFAYGEARFSTVGLLGLDLVVIAHTETECGESSGSDCMRVWRTADLSWLRSSGVATDALEALLPDARDLPERPQRQASAIPDVHGFGASRMK